MQRGFKHRDLFDVTLYYYCLLQCVYIFTILLVLVNL